MPQHLHYVVPRVPAQKASAVTKTPVPRKKTPTKFRPRPLFKFETHESNQYLIQYKGKKRVLRVYRGLTPKGNEVGKTQAKISFIDHLIFHMLFPKNSITPVGVAYIRESASGIKRYGVVSEILRGRTIGYKAYQKAYYNQGSERKRNDQPVDISKGGNNSFQQQQAAQHQQFVWHKAPTVSERIESAGIGVRTHEEMEYDRPWNPTAELPDVANINGQPVFFECDIHGHGEKVLKYCARAHPELLQRITRLVKERERLWNLSTE